MTAIHRVDQADLQGNILCGYGDTFMHAWYLFLHVRGDGRRWLARMTPSVTPAARHALPECTVNVSFTFGGLRAMGVPEQMLETFPKAFRVGMATRSELLGDTGDNRPTSWEPGLREHVPHALVTLFARSPVALVQKRRAVLADAAEHGLELVHEIEAQLLDHPTAGAYAREHFGFADGLSQPTIEGNAGNWERKGGGTPERGGRWSNLAPGEFVLGYRDEDGMVADVPASPLRRSGSYTVVRKLHQHVGRFNSFLDSVSGGDGERREWLAARIVGRWRNGAPLSLSPHEADDDLVAKRKQDARLNDFRYEGDENGIRCPLGAHIRRANPRDALGWEGRLTRRHRIIRRGMPYGPPLPDGVPDDGADRGLVFVCHQASIERQFELIQREWINDGDSLKVGADRDPLTGTPLPGGKMTIQGDPSDSARQPAMFISGLPEFVTLRGGGYFFTPGLGAMRAVAAGYWV